MEWTAFIAFHCITRLNAIHQTPATWEQNHQHNRWIGCIFTSCTLCIIKSFFCKREFESSESSINPLPEATLKLMKMNVIIKCFKDKAESAWY